MYQGKKKKSKILVGHAYGCVVDIYKAFGKTNQGPSLKITPEPENKRQAQNRKFSFGH